MKTPRKKYLDWQDVVIFILALGFLLIIFASVLAVAFPSTASQVMNNARVRVTKAVNTGPGGLQEAIQERAEHGYKDRVKPIVNFVAKGFQSSQSDTKKPSFEAGACLECHKEIFNTTSVTSFDTSSSPLLIRMDHLLHEAQGLDCDSCHMDIDHKGENGAPKRIPESICISCHKKQGGPVKTANSCSSCHPQGTIFATASGRNMAEFMSGSKGAINMVPEGMGHPAGEKAKICTNCHNIERFCTRCHGMTKNKEIVTPHASNWINIHGSRVMTSQATIIGCGNCHTQLILCATACHPNINRERRSPNWATPRMHLPQT